MGVNNCENCGRPIGKLEQPYVWRKHVVCAECHVHLSAPATAATAHAGPSIAGRRHFHVSAAPSNGGGRGAPPIAVAPESPKASAPPILLCAACGRACAFDEVVSAHGKVTCRACARAAAAEKTAIAAAEARRSIIRKVCVGAAAVIALGVVMAGMYFALRARSTTTMATHAIAPAATQRPAAVPKAEADASPARGTEASAASNTPAPEDATVETFSQERKVLFPVPTAGDPAPTVAQASAEVISSTATGGIQQQTPTVPLAVPPEVRPARRAQAPERDFSSDAAAALQDATAPALPPVAPPPEGTTDWFVFKGKELLAQRKYQPALQQFADAIKKDRSNPDAWHGSGICYQYMGDRATALNRLEKAASLYNRPNRAVVFNVAGANLRDNPMRAAKLVRDFLAREDVPLDEQLHTMLGKALFSVNRQGRLHPAYTEAEAFFFEYGARLDSSRTDGRRRWGGEWVPGAQATEKWTRYRSGRDNTERLRREVDRATKQKKDTWDRLLDQQTGMRLRSTVEQREAKRAYEQAATREIALRQQLQQAEIAFNSIEKPPFPQLLRPLPIDAGAPLSPGARAR